MIRTTLIRRGKRSLKKIEPTEKPYITNGEMCAEWVYLGKNDSIERWSETDTDFYEVTDALVQG